MRGRPIWTNIDNTDNRHTLKRLQDPARYGQRGQPKTDTPPPRVHIHARNGGFLRRNGRFCSRNSGFLRQKAPFMQQEAKASTDEKRPATCRHHRPALRLYHTRPARYGQRGQYGQRTKENNRPARVVLCTPRVSVSTTEQPKASTPPEYGQRGQYGQRGHRRPPLCVRICPVVCPYLQRTPKPPPAPNRGIYRQTPRRGGAASTQPALIWTTWTIWTNARRVEAIQAHRHEGQT